MRRRIILCVPLAGMLSLWCAQAQALDPALDISQYAHTAWKIRDGFSTSVITSVAQTQDGYLWLGTGTGLLRFDGVRNTPWQPPTGSSLPDGRIRALFVSRDATLWIGTLGGLASWGGGKLRTYPQFAGGLVNAIVEDREGTVWVGAAMPSGGILCAIHNTVTDCVGDDGRFGASVSGLYQDNKGALWAVASNTLWRWKPGPAKQFPLPGRARGLQSLSESATGAILIVTDRIWQLVEDKFEPFAILGVPEGVGPSHLFRDRDGALWIGTANGGLLHVHDGRTDAFGQLDGLSGDFVERVFEDREGNVWVASQGGLDRFRTLPATTHSAAQGLLGFATSVLADGDGGVWVATATALYRWRDPRFSVYRARSGRSSPSLAPAQGPKIDKVAIEGLPTASLASSLLEDSRGRIWLGSPSGLGYLKDARFVSIGGVPSAYIDSIVEDKQGNLWVAHRDAGLLRVSTDLKIEQVKWPNSGKAGDWWRLAIDPVEGLWLGSAAGGVVHLVNGMVRASYSAAEGLGKGGVYNVRVAADGTVWAATLGGLSRIKGGRIATLSSKNGLPCDAVNASIEDDERATWLYTDCGLVRIARADLEAWSAAMDQGKPALSVTVTVLGNGDGVHVFPSGGSSSTPHLALARDGKLWFVTRDGVTTVDPNHLSINTLPPPVHVDQLVADRKPYAPSGQLSLPPLVRDLTIDYTALSLVAPEKMQFRYRLEGRDRDWEDAGNRRQAFYTDLAPGNYRFRVIASNNSGVWNEEGAALGFSIAPAYWQTNWFIALCATAFVVLLWGGYRMRMRQIAWALNNEKRHREMEIELAHANRLAMMGQLTASIAHEVNQPLGAAITNAQAGLRWLKREPPDLTEVKTAFDEVVRAGNRAADVVASVRRMVKKAPGQGDNVRVNDEITEIVAITHGEATKHGVSVRTELAPHLPAIKADRVELQQVLLNLIVNAIEAMSSLKDGVRELVIRSEADEGGGVVVSVIDTGPGLDPAALERIFQAFYTTKESGLGMGLAICRSIIESHGGKLWCSPNSPRGAVFQFTLPRTGSY